MEVYELAGGEVRRDLFDERSQGYALNVALVAEGWVEIRPEIDWRNLNGFERVYPSPVETSKIEQAELVRLQKEQEELEALVESEEGDEGTGARLAGVASRMAELDREAYASADFARAGAFVSLDYSGCPALLRLCPTRRR